MEKVNVTFKSGVTKTIEGECVFDTFDALPEWTKVIDVCGTLIRMSEVVMIERLK